ncbi:MAG: polysaccharide biosynthesis C-terminal domain-containing protein [Halioglobus sp.]
MAILLILYADYLVPMLLGEVWRDAVLPVQILSVASMLFALSGDPSVVLRSIGKPDIAFNISLWNTILVGIPALLIGTKSFGTAGAAWATVIHYATSRIICQYYMRREIHVSEMSVLRASLPAFIIAVTMIILGAGLENDELFSNAGK